MPKTEAQIRANVKFESKAYDKILIRLRKDRPDPSGLSREIIQKAADAKGLSVNAFILEAINAFIE